MEQNLEPDIVLKSKDWYCEWVLSRRLSIEVERESERVLAFHHIKPNWDIHIVLIPKEHVTRLVDIRDGSLLQEIMEMARDIIIARGLAETNYKIITNGGSYQYSQHLHFHLVSGNPKKDYGE